MKRPGEENEPPGGRPARRRRQFEESRGLSGRRELPLDEEPAANEAEGQDQEADEPPAEDHQDAK